MNIHYWLNRLLDWWIAHSWLKRPWCWARGHEWVVLGDWICSSELCTRCLKFRPRKQKALGTTVEKIRQEVKP